MTGGDDARAGRAANDVFVVLFSNDSLRRVRVHWWLYVRCRKR